MVDGEFCVVCGRTGQVLTDGLCSECAAGRMALVRAPGRARITLCPTCGARKVGAHWERAGSSRLLTGVDLNPFLILHPEVALRSVQWEEIGANALEYRFQGNARVRFRGTERSVDVALKVKVDHHTCPECSRQSGHYYTAVLQLRPALDGPREKAGPMHERLDRAWDQLLQEAREDWRQAISWRESRPEGWDYFAVDTLAARALARLARQKLRATIKESATLVGRKDGVDVYRVTFCLRLPPPAPPEAGTRRSPSAGVEQYS